uniref:Uncharacterized protein n=2 Tax=Cacopsylla melanoneura TaxID=428564 RepID=A0A8D9E6Z6_9HEMI
MGRVLMVFKISSFFLIFSFLSHKISSMLPLFSFVGFSALSFLLAVVIPPSSLLSILLLASFSKYSMFVVPSSMLALEFVVVLSWTLSVVRHSRSVSDFFIFGSITKSLMSMSNRSSSKSKSIFIIFTV